MKWGGDASYRLYEAYFCAEKPEIHVFLTQKHPAIRFFRDMRIPILRVCCITRGAYRIVYRLRMELSSVFCGDMATIFLFSQFSLYICLHLWYTVKNTCVFRRYLSLFPHNQRAERAYAIQFRGISFVFP